MIVKNRNYQKELDAIIERNEHEGTRPSLLLHVCCAPCSSYVQEYLDDHFDITLLFYNPNMDSAAEYDHRSAELLRLIKEAGFSSEPVICEYDPESFDAAARGMETEEEGGKRCYRCYELRMRRAACYAAEHNFDYFTTTLSISPYKNAEWINEIGENLGKEYGVRHLPSDFKKKNGYKRSIELSRQYDLYRQDYCGCVYSKNSREKKKGPRDEKTA
ncbi:MAG: epoxyqueuosine reductase QueH [Lachnospiraceae bacterium]|nr:epoxyqueuosine reductase QueH [Lachnospiraceae bacterium]